MTDPQRDPLEERMRHALQDDGWALPSDEGMLDRVHTGATRRRRRHQAGVALAAVAVVAGGVGATGYVTSYVGNDQPTAASRQQDSGDSTLLRSDEARKPSGAAEPQEKTNEERSSEEPNMPPERETDPPKPSDMDREARKPVPGDFHPASLTATSTTKFWVLGAAGDNASVAVTDNAGKTFAQVGGFDARVANDQTTDATTVHDIRFADDLNGWAYGDALWSTYNGGQTWQQAAGVQGEVKRLEAENGRAYALAKSGRSWTVWSTSAGSSAWQRLNVALSNPSDLATTDDTVAIADRTSEEAYTMVSEDAGATFVKRPTPCPADLSGGDLSASQGSLWLQCPTGTGSEVLVSEDSGRQWSSVDTGGDAVPTNASAVGARGRDGAVLAMPGEVRKVDGDQADTVQVDGLDTPTYSGFTTPEVGYIIDLQGNLFRTADSGSSWTKVAVE